MGLSFTITLSQKQKYLRALNYKTREQAFSMPHPRNSFGPLPRDYCKRKNPKSWKDDIKCSICVVIYLWDKWLNDKWFIRQLIVGQLIVGQIIYKTNNCITLYHLWSSIISFLIELCINFFIINHSFFHLSFPS